MLMTGRIFSSFHNKCFAAGEVSRSEVTPQGAMPRLGPGYPAGSLDDCDAIRG